MNDITYPNTIKLVAELDDKQLESTFIYAWKSIFEEKKHENMHTFTFLYNELIKRGYEIHVSQVPALYSPEEILDFEEKG